jgi:hypothetical protein
MFARLGSDCTGAFFEPLASDVTSVFTSSCIENENGTISFYLLLGAFLLPDWHNENEEKCQKFIL